MLPSTADTADRNGKRDRTRDAFGLAAVPWDMFEVAPENNFLPLTIDHILIL